MLIETMLYFKKDCFWLLSALIEFAHHNIVYSAFKETTSENFEPNGNDQVKRATDSKFSKYSKIMGSNGEFNELEQCQKPLFEPEFPIRSVPVQQIPNKK
jgi:hypothetical protein